MQPQMKVILSRKCTDAGIVNKALTIRFGVQFSHLQGVKLFLIYSRLIMYNIHKDRKNSAYCSKSVSDTLIIYTHTQ